MQTNLSDALLCRCHRCDKESVTLGLHLANFSKILKCAGNDDIITLKADDSPDSMTLMFESPTQERISGEGGNAAAVDLQLLLLLPTHLHILYMPAHCCSLVCICVHVRMQDAHVCKHCELWQELHQASTVLAGHGCVHSLYGSNPSCKYDTLFRIPAVLAFKVTWSFCVYANKPTFVRTKLTF